MFLISLPFPQKHTHAHTVSLAKHFLWYDFDSIRFDAIRCDLIGKSWRI